VANDLPYDARADLWSLGCVLFELALLYHPFPAGTVCDTDVRGAAGTLQPSSSSLLLWVIQKSMSVKYEPSSEPLHISAK